jgi:FlaA1/EpsC-like NDP-sugar epimerase
MGKGGEIYVLDMGEPIKISYLAEQMIRLSGFAPGEDIMITYTGLRPGEKMFEELFYGSEIKELTDHPKILLARHPGLDWTFLADRIEELELACNIFDEEKLKSLLEQLTPVSGIAAVGQVIPLTKGTCCIRKAVFLLISFKISSATKVTPRKALWTNPDSILKR